MARVVIAGLGSPHGDDQVGWWVAQRLAASRRVSSSGGRIEVVISREPSSDLMPSLLSAETLILVDACMAHGVPGVVSRWWGLPAAQAGARWVSSHGATMPTLVNLAAALRGSLPGLIVYGIEIGAVRQGETTLSVPVRMAAQRVQDWIGSELYFPAS